MKYLLILMLFIGSLPLFSQIPDIKSGATYAVVVGISDYQDENIPDLRFADKDALAFANFLRSPAGGNLVEDHLKVLINEQATSGKVAAALYWLIDQSTKDDQVIFYFSGHGDVERKISRQPGFLLCWDAPPSVYMAGGVIELGMLENVISTLSIDIKSRVTIITDACRSGKLSGSDIGGAQITGANLSKRYANEIKILSCQPNQYSIEGEQWGGGRGAFSYHLLDGLYGMADSNDDLTVNLMEIGRYLEDHVPTEVAPQRQLPMVVGNRSEKLTYVLPEILAELKAGKMEQLVQFNVTDSRGIEDEVLAGVDSNFIELYEAFQKALEEKKFLNPEGACADTYFRKLIKEPKLKKMHNGMRRNYAAALQDDAQQVMNKLLKSDPEENEKHLLTIQKEYGLYPHYLQRAADLLGEDHYMFKILMARSFWFEAYLKDETNLSSDNIKNADEPISLYKKALLYQPEMPHCWLRLATAYGYQKNDIDSAEYYAHLAVDAIPNWVLPYAHMGNLYLNISTANRFPDQKNTLFKKSKEWLDRGLAVDSNHVAMLNELAYWYSLNGQFDKEQEILDRSFALAPLAKTMFFKGWSFMMWGKYDEAESAYMKAIEMDSALVSDPSFLILFETTKQYGKLIKYARKSLNLGYLDDRLYDEFANALLYENDAAETIEILNDLIIAYPKDHNLYNTLGLIYLKLGESDRAKILFQKSLTIESSLSNHSNISQYCFNIENWELSLEIQKKAIQKEPENEYFIRNLGGTLLYCGVYEEAFQASEKALKILPNEQFNLLNLGILYYERGDYKKAEEYLQTSLKGEIRRQARALVVLGMLYQKTGRSAEAEKVFKKAVEMEKGNPPISWTGFYMRNDRFKVEWEQTLNLLLNWYPNREDIYIELAKLYANDGDDDKALKNLENALKNGYDRFYELSWEVNLRPIKERNPKRWKKLMQKYYPEQFTD